MKTCPECGQLLENEASRADAREIIEFLNQQSGRKHRMVDTNINLARQRIREYGKEEVARMIVKMVKKWRGTDMEEYLRPLTLFAKSKCAQYMEGID